MLPWLLFQDTVLRSAPSMVEHATLITRTLFPAEVVPVSIFLSSLIHHLIALLLVMIASVVVLRSISPMALLLPLYMLFIGLFRSWFQLVRLQPAKSICAITAQVLTVVMTLWFWFTPIMISEGQIPPRFQALLRLNPMSWIVRAYRDRLLSAQWPTWQEFRGLSSIFKPDLHCRRTLLPPP